VPGRNALEVSFTDVPEGWEGRALRDALQAPSAMDSPFVMRRP